VDGTIVSSFTDMAIEGVHHFRTFFKEITRTIIDVILKIVSIFLRFINHEENRNLMVEISKDELLNIVLSFQRDKNPSPDGLPIEFLLGCYVFLENYLLKVVKYTCSTGQILATFNSTFLALIPKSNNP
jgi:hypothetical protein